MEDRPPPPHVSPKGIWSSKLLFRILSAIFSICIIGIAAANSTDEYSDSSYYDYWSGASIVILGPAAAVGFIWDVAEGICILARRGHRGIHPGAVVAIDLLLWIGFLVSATFHGIFFIYDDYYYYSSSYSHSVTMSSMNRALLALSVFEIVFHLTLFIFGCYETHIRNRRGPIIIYTSAPPMGPMQPNPYGPQPIILPVGQAPPAGYVPYAFGPTQPQPVHQAPGNAHEARGAVYQAPGTHEHYAPKAMSPPPQEPSPLQSSASPPAGDWRNSYQPSSSGPHHDNTQ